jgi:hypothetical protein
MTPFIAWRLSKRIEKATQEERALLIAGLQEIETRPAWQAFREVLQEAYNRRMLCLRSLQSTTGRDQVEEGVWQGELNILEMLLEPSMGVAQALKMETTPDGAVSDPSSAS